MAATVAQRAVCALILLLAACGGETLVTPATRDPIGGKGGNAGGTTPVAEEASQNYNRINPEIHYGDLMPKWINGETFEYHVTRAEVAAHAARKLRFTP